MNEVEAAVVRRIFKLSAEGTGFTRMAKLLNSERAPSPRAQRDRPRGWAPTSVKEVLDRRLYAGEIVWNRTRKRDQWGQHRQSGRPKGDWIRIQAPELRIVSEAAWSAAHGRLTRIKEHLLAASAGRIGRRHRDVESKYLLSGFARCGVCGGSLSVLSRSHGKQRAFRYGCAAYHKRGTSICGNALELPIERVDEAVLATLAGDVLKPELVMAIVDGVLAEFAPSESGESRQKGLRAELEEVVGEIARLTEGIAAGGRLPPLLAALTARQALREEIEAQIETPVVRPRFDRKDIERKVRKHVAGWRALLTKHVEDGRQLLREVLAGPLRFTPEGRTYRFEGQAAIGRMLAGSAGFATFGTSPTGFEPVFWP